MGTRLPRAYRERMREQLGDEYDSFLASYGEESCTGLRVNTAKISVEEFCRSVPFSLKPVPWTENGFYAGWNQPLARHPYYSAGLYYIQEPSAMLPAAALPVEPGDRVLDLCAAPGGKATELAAKLKGTGLLVANDASASRANALLKNLTLFGFGNICVTAETPERLLEAFGCSFDKILVDAPCSGEGMFRRDPALIRSWEERGPGQYAPLQKEILDCAVRMLKPGGMLAYSTCTFSRKEDEEVVAEILGRFPELSLREIEGQEGFAAGYPPCREAVRLWPHRVRGEGHFLALLQKKGQPNPGGHPPFGVPRPRSGPGADVVAPVPKDAPPCMEVLPPEVREFLDLLPEAFLAGKTFRQIDSQCLLLPGEAALPGKLRYLRTGLLLGNRKGGRFEPSQALAMALGREAFPWVLPLQRGDSRVARYLKGETLELSAGEALPKGWVLVTVDGCPLGWGKAQGGMLKNKYEPGWRIQ